MNLALALVLALVPASGCAQSSSPSTSPGHPGGGSTASAATTAAACPPGAYRHADPSFCVLVPAGLDRTPTTPAPDGIVFSPVPGSGEGRALRISWAKVSDRAGAEKLRAPRPHLETGTFEILETQPLPRGSFWLTYDATQHPADERYKIPSVRGVVVIETAEHVIHCEASHVVERGADPRAVARAQAAHLDACKSLVVVS
jgi:hypothetical protein